MQEKQLSFRKSVTRSKTPKSLIITEMRSALVRYFLNSTLIYHLSKVVLSAVDPTVDVSLIFLDHVFHSAAHVPNGPLARNP